VPALEQKNIAAEDFLFDCAGKSLTGSGYAFACYPAVLALPFLITLIFTNESLR
jgi:hypothetical protein